MPLLAPEKGSLWWAQGQMQSHLVPTFPTSVLTPGASWVHLCSSSSLVRKLWPLGFCNQGRNITKADSVPGPISSQSLTPHYHGSLTLGIARYSPGVPYRAAAVLLVLLSAELASSCQSLPLWAGPEP